MNEFHFIRENSVTNKMESVIYKQTNNRWIATVGEAPSYPYIAPDGKTMYLGKYYKERTDTGWSEQKSLGSPFAEINITSLSVSLKGT